MVPELVVIHNISLPAGQFGGVAIEHFFCNCLDTRIDDSLSLLQGLRVSAHFLIRRDGEVLQFVPTHRRAWHAGISSWAGRSNCNDFSVGIELEGTDSTAYTDAQYLALTKLICVLRAQYPTIRADAIVGHSDIAPGRKTDPGAAFDWKRLQRLLDAASSEGENR